MNLTYGTSTIDFLPVCSNCNQIIYDNIEIIESICEVDQTGIEYKHSTVHPRQCPYCNQPFDGVRIPMLPFDNSIKVPLF